MLIGSIEMTLTEFFKFSERPANIPEDAERFWPIVDVVSLVGLLSKPFLMAMLAFAFWAAENLGLPISLGLIFSALPCVALLIACIPALVRVYWDTQIIYKEERLSREARRANKRAAAVQKLTNAA